MDKKPIPILVIDDEENILNFISKALRKEGYEPHAFTDVRLATAKLPAIRPQVVISDIVMPHINGFEVLEAVKRNNVDTNLILITAHASLESAISAVRGGALDYLVKPFELDELLVAVRRALGQKRLSTAFPSIEKKTQSMYQMHNLIGTSSKMQEIYKLLEKIAKSDSTVLVVGESGTGKEMVARAIHYNSHRKDKPFVSINCASLPDPLLESELFGHERGSFTGAFTTKLGLLELAKEGTFLLDEVGDMSLAMQSKLLRALQEREIKRVGGIENIPIDVRIISATSKDLRAEIEKKNFREDLFYRINVIPVFLPPLRERKEDIPPLIQHIASLLKEKSGIGKEIEFTPDGLGYLMEYHWPGNIRELENILERLYMLADKKGLSKEDIIKILSSELKSEKSMTQGGTMLIELKNETEHFERKMIEKALEDAGGNKLQAAKLLHCSRQTLQYKVRKYNLD
ncbi:MAG: sigma-54-dependent Fis family transcriptional regulator [Candidatus Omnitrophica bacterium]|nr:sigma-54-dependent Fis family transcriptional regulator [Candidatus Omnitrophota bacterium]